MAKPMIIEMKKKGAKWFGRCEASRWQWTKIPFPGGYSFARVKRIWQAEWKRDGVPVRIVLAAAWCSASCPFLRVGKLR